MEKKIAVFSIHSDPLARLGSRESGGQNLYVRAVVKELDRLGWTVDVFTRLDDRDKNEISKLGKRSRVIRLRGGLPVYVPKIKLHPFFPELYRNFEEFARTSGPYDMVHAHHYDGGAIAMPAAKRLGVPLVTNFHSLGAIRKETQKKFSKGSEDDALFEERLAMERAIASFSDVIISLSETEKDDLVKYYAVDGRKVRVIPGGVDLSDFKRMDENKAREATRVEKDAFIALFVGRLEWRKGVATLLEAAAEAKKRIPELKVVVAGGKIFGRRANLEDLQELERLKAIAESLGITDSVKFTGSINHSDLPKYYSSADVLVVPSYYEPFGLVALEGMASSLPVVASNVGGLSKIIVDGRNGLLFPPNDAKSLARHIVRLRRDPALANYLGDAARKDAESSYSWRKVVSDIDDIYGKLILRYAHENRPSFAF